MKNLLMIVAAITISVIVSVYCIDYATDLRGGDLCQLALDREYKNEKPLIRRWHLEKEIKGDKLYLVEFQYGAQNNTPHLTHVLVRSNLTTKLYPIQ